jgi:hypothetical protein
LDGWHGCGQGVGEGCKIEVSSSILRKSGLRF